MTKYIYQDKLESERLITRKLTINDIPAWIDFISDGEAMEHFPDFGKQTVKEKSKQWISRQLSRYAENRFGLQAIIEKDTNLFIGQCGLLSQEIDGKPELEVGYHIFKKYWGQGFAPEAASIFIDYAFKKNLSSSVISIIDKRNKKSQRVAEKNGLAREKETIWMGLEVYIYRIYKEHWKF
ncbi:MAG: GNAT family N-acetyltransferase [Bacteroidetes bacterium]|nr:GNAT family N-acetyltransferase [Bacteroidota bacterium]